MRWVHSVIESHLAARRLRRRRTGSRVVDRLWPATALERQQRTRRRVKSAPKDRWRVGRNRRMTFTVRSQKGSGYETDQPRQGGAIRTADVGSGLRAQVGDPRLRSID